MTIPRAVIFDLDDTLYPERRFALSGFAAVATHLERTHGLSRDQVFGLLLAALRAGRRAVAFQDLCDRLPLARRLIPQLVAVVRTHRPRLRLPAVARRVLADLGGSWRLGVLTNGFPAVQARKVEALGLRPLVDVVVFAAEHGTGHGKPEPRPFHAAAARLGLEPRQCVLVGDDPWCDIGGGRAVGMATVRVTRGSAPSLAPADEADVVVRSLAEVPGVVRALEGRMRGHAT